jgi:hypothetical protein
LPGGGHSGWLRAPPSLSHESPPSRRLGARAAPPRPGVFRESESAEHFKFREVTRQCAARRRRAPAVTARARPPLCALARVALQGVTGGGCSLAGQAAAARRASPPRQGRGREGTPRTTGPGPGSPAPDPGLRVGRVTRAAVGRECADSESPLRVLVCQCSSLHEKKNAGVFHLFATDFTFKFLTQTVTRNVHFRKH